ncbi:hypothetical protein [Pseudolysinimonas yzui]|uniref:T3SS peptide-binding chaperone domain-containing protein n=1 Tax=Pseudolysinimonas yzui TaxID=2708254 RepID=A0A8J3GRT2_9MICO|nr:hypothetical protein [Pseudolysinimonas yzui]GHF22521.1 hypothetical protein GCM10011600_24550 [Pseudolysinimonas yzui]
MRPKLDDRLLWLTAWRLIAAVEKDVAGTSLREVSDALDGRTLLLSTADHPCVFALNQRRGVTVLAPILIEQRGWLEIVSSSLSEFVTDLKLTLAWPSNPTGANGAARTHAVIARLLAAVLDEQEEYWLSGVSRLDESSNAFQVFPLWADQVAAKFQDAALAGGETSSGEAWILWRDASPVALFDDSMGVFVGGCRWDYGDLAIEVAYDFRYIAHQILGVIQHHTENLLLPPREV